MSIIIKNLLSSDPLSEALEKINFNFDQIVLSGGGPPGPQGDKGPQGIAGPKGDDGTRWFTGTSIPTGALTDDVWLKSDGTVWKYGTNTWSNTGVTLLGATGATGVSGSSIEIKIYPGRTGGSLTGSSDAYVIESASQPLLVDNSGFNFIVPTNSNKNSLYLGPLDLPFTRFVSWNSIDILKGTASTATRLIPKITLIQNAMDYTGYGGLTIGARGATSSNILTTDPTTNNFLSGETTNARIHTRDFFNAGYYVKSPRNTSNPYANLSSTYTHGFLMSMYTMDLDLQAGTQRGQDLHTSLGDTKIPSLNFKSYRIHLEDFERNRTIYSGYDTTPNTSIHQSFIEINAKPTIGNIWLAAPAGGTTLGWVGLQTQQNAIPTGYEHAYGTVVIGSTGRGTLSISRDNRSALNISRPITKIYDATVPSSLDSHITFWTGTENSPDDFLARFSGIRPSTYDANRGYLLLQSRKFGIIPRLSTINQIVGSTMNAYIPKFPLHVISRLEDNTNPNLNHLGFVGESLPSPYIVNTIAAFNSVRSTGASAMAGLAVVNYRQIPSLQRVTPVSDTALQPNLLPLEIGLNTYWAGPDVEKLNRYSSVVTDTLRNPDLHLQMGPEFSHGNVAIGFIANPTANATQSLNIRAASKLSVCGSMTVAGIDEVQGAYSSYFHSMWSVKPKNGIMVEGPIWRGAHQIGFALPMKFIGVTGDVYPGYPNVQMASTAQYLATSPSLKTEDVLYRQLGIVTTKDVAADGYISLSSQSRAFNPNIQDRWNPSYSLFDFRTGIDMQQISEGLLVVNNHKHVIVGASGGTSVVYNPNSTNGNGTIQSVGYTGAAQNALDYRSITAAKFSNRTDFVGLTGPGFQVTSRFATQTRYMNASQLEVLIKPYYGAIYRYNSTDSTKGYHDYQWEGFYLPIPTDFSMLVLDLTDNIIAGTITKQFQPHSYNAASPSVYSPGPTNINKMFEWQPPTVGTTSLSNAFGLATVPRNIESMQYTDPDLPRKRFQIIPNNLIVTLQEGLYDGQEFTLYVNRCAPVNQVTLTGDPIPITMNQPFIIDDANISGVNSVGGPANVANIGDIKRIIMGLDSDIPPSTVGGLPYTVQTTATDFPGYISRTTYSPSINNTSQSLVSTTNTTRNGVGRVTPINGGLYGSFRFRPNRIIKFKWCRVYDRNIDSTGNINQIDANRFYYNFSASGSTAGSIAAIHNQPIPGIIDNYEKSQVAPWSHPRAGGQYAWVEVSRTYAPESANWTVYQIAKL